MPGIPPIIQPPSPPPRSLTRTPSSKVDVLRIYCDSSFEFGRLPSGCFRFPLAGPTSFVPRDAHFCCVTVHFVRTLHDCLRRVVYKQVNASWLRNRVGIFSEFRRFRVIRSGDSGHESSACNWSEFVMSNW